jgi:homoserine O-succinyltransferase
MSSELGPSQEMDSGLDALKIIARGAQGSRPLRISVGIVNGMPDAALRPTERQFMTALQDAAGQFEIRIQMFSLPGIEREGAAADRVKSRYLEFSCLHELHMDALVVTGATPKAGVLKNEPFWPHLSELAEWASTNTLSVLWSCLSAHAAVQHLDGIKRRRLPKKLSGLFEVDVAAHDALFAGMGSRMRIPHSRYNGLPEKELRESGYEILSRSDAVGADIFTKSTPSSFVFFQGHPEYDADTLMREYRRDALKYLAGDSDEYPHLPANYFDSKTEAMLERFAGQARLHRNNMAAEEFPSLDDANIHLGALLPGPSRLFRNWIEQVAVLKARQLGRRGVAA